MADGRTIAIDAAEAARLARGPDEVAARLDRDAAARPPGHRRAAQVAALAHRDRARALRRLAAEARAAAASRDAEAAAREGRHGDARRLRRRAERDRARALARTAPQEREPAALRDRAVP